MLSLSKHHVILRQAHDDTYKYLQTLSRKKRLSATRFSKAARFPKKNRAARNICVRKSRTRRAVDFHFNAGAYLYLPLFRFSGFRPRGNSICAARSLSRIKIFQALYQRFPRRENFSRSNYRSNFCGFFGGGKTTQSAHRSGYECKGECKDDMQEIF